MRVVQGIAAARGFALGPAFQFQSVSSDIQRRTVADTGAELERLEQALLMASRQLEAVGERAKTQLSVQEASIFQAQLLMLQDPELLEQVRKSIREESVNAECAVQAATEQYAQALESMDSEYFRARATDVRDISQRLVGLLLNPDGSARNVWNEPAVVMARDLLPSDTVSMDRRLVLGFCTVEGSETSHTAILARALGIPALVGCPADILGIPNGTEVILSGPEGRLYIEPTAGRIEEYRAQRARSARSSEIARTRCHEPAVTLNGTRVKVTANIGSLASARTAVDMGAEGVGLLRTEFLYMERGALPDEDEQTKAYSAILDVLGQRPVTLRTIDIGGDKPLPYLQLPHEMNPFLGVRGLRLALLHPAELLKPQLRAALRAAVGHELHVMFPMVARREEIRRAREIMQECRTELVAEGRQAADRVLTGIMVEIPAAAIMADVLSPEVDFFSIGTNDLTQYTLAADRTNSQLGSYGSAFAPAVLRLIQNVITQAHKCGKPVAVCGELAGEPLAIPILLGFGLDEFSMNPQAIPAAKEIVRSVKLADCQQLAEQVLRLESAGEVKDLVADRISGAAGA